MNKISLKGKVLVAEPFLDDPNFRRTAVMICDHSKEEGTVGFILNRPIEMRIDEVVEDFPEFDAEVYFGGPVKTDTVHYLHRVGNLLEGSTKIVEGVYWGGDFDKLKFLIEQELVKPDDIQFFVGYSGWADGQLEDELNLNTWVIEDMFSNYLFKTDPFALWSKILIQKGDNYSVIAQMPDTALLN